MVSDAIDAGERDRRRGDQATAWMWEEVRQTLVDRLLTDPVTSATASAAERAVARGEITPAAGAKAVLGHFADGG